MRPLFLVPVLVLVLGLVLFPRRAHAAEEETTPTIWPAHVAGIVGGLGLVTAVAMGSLQMNADHSARITEATLAGSGMHPGACSGDSVRADLDQMCSLLARHRAASEVHADALAVALGVGLTSIAFAVVWYVIAK
jgi:hypothetical protein